MHVTSVPSTRTINEEMAKGMMKNPYGMMLAATKLRRALGRTGEVVISRNELRRRCLGELIQSVRAAVEVPRDTSNNRKSLEALWRTFLTAKEEDTRRRYKPMTKEFLACRVRNLNWNLDRHRRRANVPLKHGIRMPMWRVRLSNQPSEDYLNAKLRVWADNVKRCLSPRDLAQAKEEIWNHFKKQERDSGAADRSVLTSATWNVDKGARNISEAIVSDQIPAAVDFVMVTEASMGVRRTDKVLLPRRWKSTSRKHTAIVAPPHAQLRELVFGQAPPPPGDVEESGSTEYTAARIVMAGKEVCTAVCAYFPPDAATTARLETVFNDFVRKCVAELGHGAVIIGGDFNFHLGGGNLSDVHRQRRRIWEEAWAKVDDVHIRLASSVDTPTFTPAGKGAPSVLDGIFILMSKPAAGCPGTIRILAGSQIVPMTTMHALVTAQVSLPVMPPVAVGPAEFKMRTKWEELRFNRDAQDALRPTLEEGLLSLIDKGEFNGRSIAEWVTRCGRETLGETKITVPPPGAIVRRTHRAGAAERRRLPWWNTELEKLSEAIKGRRRLLESRTQVLNRLRVRRTDRFQVHKRYVEVEGLRKKLRALLRDARTMRGNAKIAYHDDLASKMGYNNSAALVAAHRICKRVKEARSGKGRGTVHPSGTMNAAWKQVFEGNGAELSTAAFLDEGVEALEIACEKDGAEEITISYESVDKALRQLKCGKAPGLDGTTNESLRLIEDPRIIQALADLFTEIVNDPSKLELDWKKGLVALIEKKENPKPLDYRPIALLSHLAKLLELAVKVSLEEDFESEAMLGAAQGGFRARRGVDLTSLTVASINALAKAGDTALIAIFLDIKKAYDSVPAKVLAACLERKKLPPRMIRFLYQWVCGHKRKLIVPGNDDDEEAWLDLLVGVPQGSILSPWMFGIVMDSLNGFLKGESVLGLAAITPVPALDVQEEEEPWIRELMFADDSLSLTTNLEEAQEVLDQICVWSAASGLVFHPDKFAVVRMGADDEKKSDRFAPRRNGRRGMLSTLRYDGQKLPVVSKTLHLGLTVHSNTSAHTFSVDTARRFRGTVHSTNALAFAFRPKPNGARVQFTATLNRSVVEGGAYFGSSLVHLTEKDMSAITTIIGNGAKAALGIHRSVSTTNALRFLGWNRPEVELALRRLGILERALFSSPPEITSLVKEMMTLAVTPPFVKLLNASMEETMREEMREEEWPTSGGEWRELLAKNAEEVRDWFKRSRSGIARNHQHPIIRVAKEHAAISFRFCQPSLKPFKRAHDHDDVCQLCGVGRNSGFHLLAECLSTKARSVTAGILSRQWTNAWKRARADDDFSHLNELITEKDPWLRDADKKARNLLLVAGHGNDLDVLARILRVLYISDTVSNARTGESEWRAETLIHRSGKVLPHVPRRTKWSQLIGRKNDLMTAYTWIGHLTSGLWQQYCRRKTEADTGQPPWAE